MSHDVSSLLRIDFEAALAKLAWAQLQGAWEIPAELARLAIATGAREVAIDVSAKRLTLRASGSRLERRMVSDFASMLDRELEPEERHRAMVELEAAEAFVLSAIACSPVESVVLRIGGEHGMRLEMRRGARLGVIHPGTETDAARDLFLEIGGLPIDADKAVRWLTKVGRFAAVPVTVGGRRIDAGFSDPLITGRLDAFTHPVSLAGAGASAAPPSLRTSMAIPRRGSAPRLWLLRHGIIATRATVPGRPSFEAAIEMAPVAGAGRGPAAGVASPADLRERLGPYLRSILDAAASLTIRLGQGAASLAEPVRNRVARLLLEGVRKRLRVAEASGVRIFVRQRPQGCALVSIDEIARSVRVESGGVCALDAISPDQDPGDFVLPERGVLVLGESERALLGEHLCAVFDTPPARLHPSPGRRLLGRLTEVLGRTAVRPFLRRGEPVAEPALSDGERRFLSRLRAALAEAADGEPPAVAFHSGAGAAFRDRGGIVLPRSNPDVRRSVEAVERDAIWLYPAMVALLEGPRFQDLGLARSEAHRAWLSGKRSCGSPTDDRGILGRQRRML
jgi:hypothetical protein